MPSTELKIPFEAYSGPERYLFVSYAHKDSQVVFPEITFLHEQGYRVWYDEGIDPGNEWPEMIAKALEGCSQFLVFVSPNAVNSQNVRNEINFAINRGKPFLAVHIEETALPTGLELRMGDIQAILKYRMDVERYRRQIERALKGNIRILVRQNPSYQGVADQSAPLPSEEEHPSLQPKPVIVNASASPIQNDVMEDDNAVRTLATRIVIEGTDVALKEVRFARFGALDVVDPREVDSFLDLHRLIQEYQKQPQRVPLPIAVFSPPGEPRVFCVQQVVDAVVPFGVETCIFSIPSFVGVDALNNAFHRVREIGSSGKTPLVFWEDFDSQLGNRELGWLRYFNPVLESGSYADGKATYQVGNAIFAFLSGTAEGLKHFGLEKHDYGSQAAFRASGGSIFLSCLKGYLEIFGLNPHQTEPDHDENPATTVQDRYCVIRRAVWLRHCLRRRTPWLFREAHDAYTLNIDLGVLSAFLNVRCYNHGFRSMESIIGMSALIGKPRFAPESLPSSSQLDLHLDGREFLSFVHEAKPSVQP